MRNKTGTGTPSARSQSPLLQTLCCWCTSLQYCSEHVAPIACCSRGLPVLADSGVIPLSQRYLDDPKELPLSVCCCRFARLAECLIQK